MDIVLAKEKEKSIMESLIDGEGVRLVMFTCGCPHHCEGCHNDQTWNIKDGVQVDVDEVVGFLKEKFYKGRFKGITLSGGDPLYQSNELLVLVQKIKEQIPEADIWCFTGFIYEKVQELEVLKYIDVLIDGRFEKDKMFPKKPYRGSNNQRLLRLKNGKITSIE
jgi:anaerobic ribonucleoside-triphosphate reductase activating protein